MWPGPYGQGGGSRKYVLARLDQSLRRMGLEYVDIFYSHRFDPDTPLEETMMALDHAVRSGKALYVGISSYSASKTRQAAAIARDLGTPLLIHQPSYSMLNRWIETEAARRARGTGHGLHRLHRAGPGSADRPLPGRHPRRLAGGEDRVDRPAGAPRRPRMAHVRGWTRSPRQRGQKLAQLALQWALRDRRVTSAVIGASSVEQLDMNLDALDGPPVTDAELAAIDDYAVESGINLWAKQTDNDAS